MHTCHPAPLTTTLCFCVGIHCAKSRWQHRLGSCYASLGQRLHEGADDCGCPYAEQRPPHERQIVAHQLVRRQHDMRKRLQQTAEACAWQALIARGTRAMRFREHFGRLDRVPLPCCHQSSRASPAAAPWPRWFRLAAAPRVSRRRYLAHLIGRTPGTAAYMPCAAHAESAAGVLTAQLSRGQHTSDTANCR